MKEDEVESEEKSGQFSTGFRFLLNRCTDFQIRPCGLIWPTALLRFSMQEAKVSS